MEPLELSYLQPSEPIASESVLSLSQKWSTLVINVIVFHGFSLSFQVMYTVGINISNPINDFKSFTTTFNAASIFPFRISG